MVELEASTQKDGGSLPRWKKPVPPGAVTLGRVLPQCDWAVPWDDKVSRKHAVLTWDEKTGRLLVQVLAQARNPAFHQGKTYMPGAEFCVLPTEHFIIGNTSFQLVQAPEPGFAMECDRTCNFKELRALSYADAEIRIEVLSALPELIRQSPSDEEFDERVVQMLLQGVPRAHTAALVWIDPDTATEATEVKIQRLAERAGSSAQSRISRGLVYRAVCRHRQTCLHHWGTNAADESSQNNQSLGKSEWAICTPLADESTPGWGLYVAGAKLEGGQNFSPSPKQLEDSDIKFVGTVAELISSLRALRTLQKRQAVLGRFFSPSIREALASQNIEEVLKPRVAQVTVLCCDLRGSCRIAEEGEADLEATCDRLSLALEEMTRRVSEADGIISDFQGDAAMCFWGWPQVRDNDVEQAARAALAISRGFALLSSRPGSPLAGFACGLGLASGPGVAGRLGTMDQFKIGVFGPTINLAARLESLTKLFGVQILADDATGQRLKGKVRIRSLATIQPYGMTRQLMIHEIMPPVNSEVKTITENQHLDYKAGREKFVAGDWNGADRLLARLPSDGPSQFLRKYMRDRNMQPPDDWKGVIVLSAK